jgi:Outer membrane protein beta-barrel domain
MWYGVHTMWFVVLWLLVFALPGFSQHRPALDFGIRAGRPQTPVLDVQNNQCIGLIGLRETIQDPAYTVGPTLEVGLNDRLSVQMDAMYKLLRYENTYSVFNLYYGGGSTRASWWEFPVRAKWKFSNGEVQPFASGGISFNRVRGTTNSYQYTIATGSESRSSSPFRLDGPSFGFVAGGGVELKAGPFRIAPELRYTHWTRQYSQPGQYAWPNQFDILTGFTFKTFGRPKS